MEEREQRVRDQIAEHDVTMMRSYLEVDVAEWLSTNKVPFAYEAFTVPSIIGPSKSEWDKVVESIRAIGNGERVEIELPDGRVMDTADIQDLWLGIYEKHQLQDETIGVPPRESLRKYDKTLMLPDFAIYKDADMKRAGDDFDWGEFDYLVEVSGLYGVGIPDEATEDEWWDWYRASAVAFKELGYELLGLGDKVKWVVPNEPYIEGHSAGLSPELRNDPAFTVMNTTQAGIQLDELANEMGITAEQASSNLSAPIAPTKYKRPNDSTGEYPFREITPVEYEFDGVDFWNIDENPDVIGAEGDFIIYFGDMGEVYVQDDHAHVRESQWRNTNMIMLREYVLDALNQLDSDGIVTGLQKV